MRDALRVTLRESHYEGEGVKSNGKERETARSITRVPVIRIATYIYHRKEYEIRDRDPPLLPAAAIGEPNLRSLAEGSSSFPAV